VSIIIAVEYERRRRASTARLEAEAGTLSESYRRFLREAWPVIEPATPIVDGWYVDALADHCAAWVQGEIPSLMIHFRPRAGKTNIVSVCLGGWIWARHPGARMLWASYSAERRDEDSRRTRALVTSEWYQARWHRPLAGDQQVKHRFALAAGGYRYSAIYGSGATGDGGDYLGLDDPQCGADQYSPTELERDHRWYYETWQTRRNQGVSTPELVCMQRLGHDDLCARLRYDDPGRWQVLALQTRRTAVQTGTYWRGDASMELPLIDTALSRDGRFTDPRQIGEVLSARDDSAELAAEERSQPGVYAAQKQQAPIKRTSEGARINVFDRERHLRSFAARMGEPTLVQALARALASGWRASTGWDHGLGAHREIGQLIIWSDREREIWAVSAYSNPEMQTPLHDAIGFREAVLDPLGVPCSRVVDSRGDVGNLGKATAGGAAGSINLALSTVRYEGGPRCGEKVFGFPILTAAKLSIADEEVVLNESLGAGLVYLDASAEALALALENWTGGEAHKDRVDAMRYVSSPILRRWRAMQPGRSGVATG